MRFDIDGLSEGEGGGIAPQHVCAGHLHPLVLLLLANPGPAPGLSGEAGGPERGILLLYCMADEGHTPSCVFYPDVS